MPTAWSQTPSPQENAPARRLADADLRASILYVDDDPQFTMQGKVVLVRSGYGVVTAEDGAEAWAALNEGSYNLIIADHSLPRLSGIKLITQVRRAGMLLPIVMTSSSIDPRSDLAGVRSELAAFLPKPFSPDTLLETVEQALRIANPPRQSNGVRSLGMERKTRLPHSYWHGGINE